jgi:hypothetical protein
MFGKIAAAGVAFATVLGVASSAHAQETTVVGKTASYERRPIERGTPAPSNALELTVGGGYAQPFGTMQSGTPFPRLAREGLGVTVGIGARTSPNVSVTLGGEFNELTALRNASLRSARLGLDITAHAAPYSRVDPFLTIGAGYRGIWQRNPTGTPDFFTHGLEIGRVNLGLDFRASKDVALGPVIGADLDMFMWQTVNSATTPLQSPRLSTFVFLGLQGRFDLGGQRVTQERITPAIATDR